MGISLLKEFVPFLEDKPGPVPELLKAEGFPASPSSASLPESDLTTITSKSDPEEDWDIRDG
jgi:hypothetical protein